MKHRLGASVVNHNPWKEGRVQAAFLGIGALLDQKIVDANFVAGQAAKNPPIKTPMSGIWLVVKLADGAGFEVWGEDDCS